MGSAISEGRDENGKVIYGYIYGSTQDEAERKRAAAIRALYSGHEQDDSVLASLNPNIIALVGNRKDFHKTT